MKHTFIPTRHGTGVLIFSALIFFGPIVLAFHYNYPYPPHLWDFMALWYVFGFVALLMVIIGPAHPHQRG